MTDRATEVQKFHICKTVAWGVVEPMYLLLVFVHLMINFTGISRYPIHAV